VRVACQIARGAGLGFLLGLATALALLAEYHESQIKASQTGNDLVLGGPMLILGVLYVFLLPWLSWGLLAALYVRPAWLAALASLLLTVPALLLVQVSFGPGSQPRPAWAYALAAALGFAVGSALAALREFGLASPRGNSAR
jgi:hypothetical protein